MALFITEIRVLKLFKRVSKKCKEAIDTLHINPPLEYCDVGLIASLMPSVVTLRGDISSFQNQLSPSLITHFKKFEFTRLVPFNCISPELYSRVSSLHISARDVFQVRRLTLLRKLIIHQLDGEMVTLSPLVQNQYLERVIIHYMHPLQAREESSLQAICRVMTKTQFCVCLSHEQDLNASLPFNLLFIKWTPPAAPGPNAERVCTRKFNVFTPDTLYKLCPLSSTVTQLTLFIKKNSTERIDLSSFTHLGSLSITISSGRRATLALPLCLQELTVEEGDVWVEALSRLVNLKLMIIRSTLVPSRSHDVAETISLPPSIHTCFIQTTLGSRFAAMEAYDKLETLSVTGNIQSIDLAGSPSIEHLAITTTAACLTVNLSPSLLSISITSTQGCIQLKNAQTLRRVQRLELTGVIETLDLRGLSVPCDLSVVCTRGQTRLLLPNYSREQVLEFFDNAIQYHSQNDILHLKSLVLVGKINVESLFVSLEKTVFPVIDADSIKTVVVHFRRHTCVGYNQMTMKLKFVSSADKNRVAIPIGDALEYYSPATRVTVVSLNRAVTIPRSCTRTPRLRRDQSRRLFGSKSPNKGLTSEEGSDSDVEECNEGLHQYALDTTP